MRRWWYARSLRARLVLGSVVPLALALVVGTVALVAIFSAGRVREVDAQIAREVDVLAELAATGQLTNPLPVPAGSPLLGQVLASDGSVLAATPSASRVLPLVPGGGDRISTEEEPAYGDAPLRVRTRAVSAGGAPASVVVAAPLGDVRRAVDALRLVLLLVVPVLVALATLLARALVGATLRPVEELRVAAVRLAGAPDGDLLPVARTDDEIARLAGTLNDVLGRLRDALAQQRAFVADAAHELRSPLASLRVQLDVARRHPGPVAVDELAAEVDRLVRLTDDLLLLARLDARAPLRRAPVDLAELAGTGGPPAVVMGDRDALQRLLRNLLENAGRVATTVQTAVQEEDGAVVLTVDDDGPGVPPADRERVFERWVRLDDARDRAEGGAGLGLALVREIAAAHGGTATLTASPLGGARVEVRLPAVPDGSETAAVRLEVGSPAAAGGLGTGTATAEG